MTELVIHENSDDISVNESENGVEISPGLAALVALIAVVVVLVIIILACYFFKRIGGGKNRESPAIMLTAPGGDTSQGEAEANIDNDFRDFLSVKDVDVTSFKSSQDISSPNTFKSCVLGEALNACSVDDRSLCSEMSDRFVSSDKTFVSRPFHNSMSMTGAGTVSRRARIQHLPSSLTLRDRLGGGHKSTLPQEETQDSGPQQK